jgi:hypothetical protein
MILHWRDPTKVPSGGGLHQVAPVGVFQPSNDAPWNRANDFKLWRAIVRDLSEELLGCDENYRNDVQPIDYEHWPFSAALQAARQAGTLRRTGPTVLTPGEPMTTLTWPTGPPAPG